jgi:uncharacterized protein (DUF1697 family)
MPTYVAFLRAINLGANRKFPQTAIRAAVEGTGATDVETYLNTGNVRLRTGVRSTDNVEQMLADAFAADRGFDVPTIVVTPESLRGIGAEIDAAWQVYGEPSRHLVTIFKRAPDPAALDEVLRFPSAPDRVVAGERCVHVLLADGLHESRVVRSKAFAALGVGTARYATVIKELLRRWVDNEGAGAGRR